MTAKTGESVQGGVDGAGRWQAEEGLLTNHRAEQWGVTTSRGQSPERVGNGDFTYPRYRFRWPLGTLQQSAKAWVITTRRLGGKEFLVVAMNCQAFKPLSAVGLASQRTKGKRGRPWGRTHFSPYIKPGK